jgi:hypothetical protein
MIQADNINDSELSAPIDKMRRHAYLKSTGIKPNEPFQLDLIFPKSIGRLSNARHIPNDYARSSLFTARNKSEPRKTLVRKKLFHYNENISILYTGIELRAEDDEIVWMQILNYGQGLPLGNTFEFTVKDLVRDVGWAKNGRNYERVRDCISRLRANEVLVLNSKAFGKSGSISLIREYTSVNDSDGNQSRYKVWIDPNMMVMFAGHTFTSHSWEKYRALSPVARRLADYIESHKHPYPLAIDKFREMCGSTNSCIRGWRRTVKNACMEVQEAKIASVVTVTKDDQICCVCNTEIDNFRDV